MQKIVLFIEPREEFFFTPLKIGNLFTNRFAIDEDGCNEVLKIYYLENTFRAYERNRLTENKGSDCISKQNEILSVALIPVVSFFF